MEQPRVSVIIPCYNAELFIDNSIESVYSQNYRNVELIVVDDGSTDNSCAKIQAWANRFVQKGTVLKYVFQENRGLGGAIDTGLKYVTGEYLSLLDADDVFLPNSIRKRAEFLDSHSDYAGVRTNGWYVNEESRRLFITSDEEKNITDLFEGLLFGRTNNWAGSYMIRTDVLFEYYPDRNIYPSRFGQNMQILLPVAYKRKFGYIDEPLMAYILHGDSHSQAGSKEEQYSKDEINQQGYRDIYLNVLDLILIDSEEYRKYRNIFDASYHRCAMLRAEKYRKQKQLTQSYRALVRTGYATLNDRICYYNAIRSPFTILLRVIRRIKSIIKMESL